MAQNGFTPIKLYSSITPAATPSAGNLEQGELAINTNDGKLFYEDSSGVVQVIATKAGASGDVVGPASATANAIPSFNGTTGKLIQNNSGATISAGVITATGFSGPLNGSVGASTPSTVVATQVDITAQGDLRLQDTTGGQYVALQAPGTIATSYTLTLPVDDGTSGQALITDGSGVLSWSSAASGDVYGPASATDNAIARYDGTTGKLIQNSAVTIADDGATVIDANSTSAGLRITQVGSGNALMVEDSANPDATPTVILGDGKVVVGHTATVVMPTGDGGQYGAGLEVLGAVGATSSLGAVIYNNAASGFGGSLSLAKSNSATIGAHASVANADLLGAIYFSGSDGTNFIRGAQIAAQVDGTPGTNDMPGRLVFSTTADGASSPTERMRIDNAGVTTITGTGIINANSTTDALRITQVGTGNALLVEDSANPDATPTVIEASGRIYIGAAQSYNSAGGRFPLLQLNGYNYESGALGTTRWSADNQSFYIALNKSRGATAGTHTVVQNVDGLGFIEFNGSDGTNFIPGASISAFVDGTPGTNDMPGRLTFSTTADGASTPTERMRIHSSGGVSIGNTTNPGAANLSVTGSIVSPTITGATLNDGYTEEVFAVSGTTPALSPTNGSIQTWTLTGNSTPTQGTWNSGQSITLMIDDGSAYTVTWSSLAVVWKTDAGVAPTLNTTGFTVITLWEVGTTIYGARVGNA